MIDYLFSLSPSIPLENVGGVALPRGGGAYSCCRGRLQIYSPGNIFIMTGQGCI